MLVVVLGLIGTNVFGLFCLTVAVTGGSRGVSLAAAIVLCWWRAVA